MKIPVLYRPVKSNWIFQKFGENLACATTGVDGKPLIPYNVLKGSFPGVCPVGSVKLYPTLGLKGHNGYDLGAWHGEPVYHSGEFSGWFKSEVDQNGGIGVDVVSNEPLVFCEQCQFKHFIKLRSWHLKMVVGYDKKPIKMGDLVGYADSTGISAGDHVHWSPKWCEADGKSIHEDNGFYGAFDPTPHFDNVFVLDAIETKKAALSAIDLARKVIFQVMQFLKNR